MLTSDVVQAAELARALRNLPEDVKKYKTIAAFEEQAKEFLDRCAAGMRCHYHGCMLLCALRHHCECKLGVCVCAGMRVACALCLPDMVTHLGLVRAAANLQDAACQVLTGKCVQALASCLRSQQRRHHRLAAEKQSWSCLDDHVAGPEVVGLK